MELVVVTIDVGTDGGRDDVAVAAAAAAAAVAVLDVSSLLGFLAHMEAHKVAADYELT